MSWNEYIQTVIDHSKDAGQVAHVDKVAILGLDGSLLTKDLPTHFQLEPEECSAIANAFATNKTDSFSEGGLYAQKTKYMLLRGIFEDDGKELGAILAKMKDQGAVSIGKCKTCIVVAHVPEGMQQGQANNAIDAVKRHLAQ